MSEFLQRIGVELPVVQAGMGGGLSGSELAASVSEAGGLGTIGILGPDELRAELAAARRLTGRPMAVNLLLPFARRGHFEAAEAADVVVTFWGRPRRRVGGTWIHQAGSVEEARAAREAGADAVIAQGVEAGGHVQGIESTRDLAAALRAALGLPIVAAGGIADADGVAAALAAGADAVACGTRFVAAEEAGVEPYWQERIVAAHPSDTVLTDAFDVGWPNAAHRVLRNSTWRAHEAAHSAPAQGARPGEGEIVAWLGETPIVRYSDAPPVAGVRGDLEALALYAGISVGAIGEVLPAAEIVARLAAGITA
jgi:nitronate monooxygenase